MSRQSWVSNEPIIAVDRNPLLHFKFTNVKIKSIKEILNAYLAAKIIKKIKKERKSVDMPSGPPYDEPRREKETTSHE